MKNISETAAGRSLSAYVVINKETGNVAGKILAHWSDSGVCRVEVYDYTNPNKPIQRGKASGYGYDKFTAACRGLSIAGVVMHNHAIAVEGWKPGQPAPEGACLTNWSAEKQAYTSCFYVSGIGIFRSFGLHCFQVI